MAWIFIGVGFLMLGLGLVRREPGVGWVSSTGPLPGQSRETRAAVRRALRDGTTADPEIDRLARQVIDSTPRLRQAGYLVGSIVILAMLVWVARTRDTADLVLHGAAAGVWIVLAVMTYRHQRRLRNYRGLKSEGVA